MKKTEKNDKNRETSILRVFLSLLIAICIVFSFSSSVFAANTGSGKDEIASLGSDEKKATLGAITVCSYDSVSQSITVAGTVNHKVMTSAKDCKIALFRIPVWRSLDGVIESAEPLAISAMSIRFEFNEPCTDELMTVSLYAAAIVYPDGKRELLAEPRFPSIEQENDKKCGFKGVSTNSAAEIAEVDAGTVIIDVFLDKLESGKNSGYLQSMGGETFFYDREYVDELDKNIRSASVGGAAVFLRLLVSPAEFDDSLSYSSTSSYNAKYRGIVITDEKSALTIYSYITFLCLRYRNGVNGSIEGFVFGESADLPYDFNFSASDGPMYYGIYARNIALVGTAASLSGCNMRLIVPISDTKSGKALHFYQFVYGIGEYLSAHTDLNITLMVESRNNAHHLSDDYFKVPIDSAEDDENESEDPKPSSESFSEPKVLPPATFDGDSYFCLDDLSVFNSTLDLLSEKWRSVSRNFIWCWHPSSDTSGTTLSVLYAYGFVALSAASAEAFIVSVDSQRFAEISHLIKYIDTDSFVSETDHARKVFGAERWEEIFPDFYFKSESRRKIVEADITNASKKSNGKFKLWDFSAGSGTRGWSQGPGCSLLRSVSEPEGGCLKATFCGENSRVYSDICYICNYSEPTYLADSMAVELSCTPSVSVSGYDNNCLYEVKIVLYSGGVTLEGKAIVKGGVREKLCLDLSAFKQIGGIDAARIAARCVNGDGSFELRTYSVELLSNEYFDYEFKEKYEKARRDAQITEVFDRAVAEESGKGLSAMLMMLGIGAIGVFAVLATGRHERKYK